MSRKIAISDQFYG